LKRNISSHRQIHLSCSCMYGEVGLAPSTENGWERVTCRLAHLLPTTAFNTNTEQALNKAQDSQRIMIFILRNLVIHNVCFGWYKRESSFSAYFCLPSQRMNTAGPLVFHLLLSFISSDYFVCIVLDASRVGLARWRSC